MTHSFFALMFRMKYINRWSLMRSNIAENLSEHSLEVAMLSHALAVIGNTYFGKSYNSELIAVKALYHDAAEILTGDLPTPVKYYNTNIKEAYQSVEQTATAKILSLLPEELKTEFGEAFVLLPEEKAVIKAADKLCAYIKCVSELDSGNKEFASAAETTKEFIDGIPLEELKYFKDNFLNAFFEPIDNLRL